MTPRSYAALIVASTVLLPSATHARPTLSAGASASFYANGTIFAVAAAPDRVYVGGDFTLIGRPTGSWVAVAPDGNPVPGRPAVDGSIRAAAGDGRGGWFIAGTIRGVGALRRSATVVHLRSNGSLDQSWHLAVTGGRVVALALNGRRLFLGGSFSRIGGKPRRALAAVDASGGRLLPWRPAGDLRFARHGKEGPQPGRVSSLALSPDARTLYVAGSFDHIGSRARLGLAAVGVKSGVLRRWNPAPNGSVYAIEPASRGTIFIAGGFTRIGGERRNAVAAVNAGNGRSLAFNVHASQYATVSNLALAGGVVYVAGDFTTLGGKSRHLLAALNQRTGRVTDWEPNVAADDVTGLAVDAQRNTVYIAGELDEVGGQRRDALAALDVRTGNVTPWDPRALGAIGVLAKGPGGVVFAGGEIAFVGGARRHGLASFSSDGSLTDWDPALEGTVRSLALRPDNSRLYVGGAFAPGDVPGQRNLAVVDVSTGALHAFGGGTNSGVWTLATSADGSTLYIGGAFVTVAGKRRVRLAALDGTTGTLLAWNSGANDLVRTLVPTDDALYVGGDFRSAGGLARARLVKLDTATGAALGWNPDPDDNVWTMQLRDETLYVGGEFGQVGGRARNGLAAVDVESGSATSWDPNADDTVRALILSPDRTRLYAAGSFLKMGDRVRGYAEFTLPSGSLTGWNPPDAFDGYQLAFQPGSSMLVIGGEGGIDVFR